MTKCKILSGRRAPQLERAFEEWAPKDIEVKHMALHDSMGNLVMAVVYEGPEETAQDTESPQEQKKDEKPVTSERCTVCAAVQFPTIVERGPYKGRHKCSVCRKTYDAQGMLPEDQAEANTLISECLDEEQING